MENQDSYKFIILTDIHLSWEFLEKFKNDFIKKFAENEIDKFILLGDFDNISYGDLNIDKNEMNKESEREFRIFWNF